MGLFPAKTLQEIQDNGPKCQTLYGYVETLNLPSVIKPEYWVD
jgi:hypothetical protein